MIMSLEEGIKHCKEVINDNQTCGECVNEHQQLLRWMNELKMHRQRNKDRSKQVREMLDLDKCCYLLKRRLPWYIKLFGKVKICGRHVDRFWLNITFIINEQYDTAYSTTIRIDTVIQELNLEID